MLKTDSEAVLQTIEVNPVSSTQRVSGKLSISQSSVVCHLHDLSGKRIRSSKWYLTHYQNIAKLLTHSNNRKTENSFNWLVNLWILAVDKNKINKRKQNEKPTKHEVTGL